ncbi:MAG: sel1 repeat family protein [Actinobacteria bacterium]|nr:sel1 repeat family protein [Actinomycetota bacterium]
MKLIPFLLLIGILAVSGWAEKGKQDFKVDETKPFFGVNREPYSHELVQRAEAGDANAQYHLGVYCESYALIMPTISNETATAKNLKLEQAAYWYRKSAEQGNMDAQYNLGLKWYTKAEEQGDKRSQARLGFCYFWGHGVKQDLKEAVKWYTKSAEQGDVKAQCYLANCYENGLGVPKDKKEAIKWYTKALDGDTGGEAQYNLNKLKSK